MVAEFKVLLMAHQIVHDPTSIPAYMSMSFSMTKLARITDFNLSNAHNRPQFYTHHIGGRSIFVVIRDLWNVFTEKLRDIASLVLRLIWKHSCSRKPTIASYMILVHKSLSCVGLRETRYLVNFY